MDLIWSQPETWVALLSLTALEIVLGVDNVIFISILVSKLEPEKRQLGRIFGLALALLTRIGLLFSLSWIMTLTKPWLVIYHFELSGRALILILGGLFLIAKSTREIHHLMAAEDNLLTPSKSTRSHFWSIVLQIGIIDIVFSLDSVITAVGLVKHLSIMVIAILISIAIMMVAAKPIGDFIDTRPTLKVLALSFLILIGVSLMGEGSGFEIPKGYIYFAMFYAIVIEMVSQRIRSKAKKIKPNS